MTTFPLNDSVTIPAATPSSDGLMSASDKTKLDNISGGGGGGGIDIKDEGNLVRSSTGFLDFRGGGVTASSDGTVTITGTSAGVETFNGRTGAVIFQQSDGDAFFLTPAEGNAAYLTQAQANAQGMPAVELGSIGSNSPIREVNSNFTLRPAPTAADFLQFYVNVGTANATAAPPGGYLPNVGLSSTLAPNESGLFIKRAGTLQFRRIS